MVRRQDVKDRKRKGNECILKLGIIRIGRKWKNKTPRVEEKPMVSLLQIK